MKLAIAATLWTFVAKHGAHVVQTLAALIQQRVLGDSTHHTRCVFGTQRQRLAVELVFKRVHLFFDNIRDFAQPTHKQRRRLNNRRANVAVGIARHQRAYLFFQPLPTCRIGRQYVVHAFDSNQFFSHGIQEISAVAGCIPKRFSM